MKNRFSQFLIKVFIATLIIGTGCNSENSAYKIAEKENTVSSFDGFLKSYPDGEKSEIAREQLYTLLKSEDVSDWIVFIDGMKNGKVINAWYGQSNQYIRDIDRGTIDWIEPKPKEQKIVILILNDTGLPKELQKNKAYLWRGGNEFTFIKEINGNLDRVDLKKQFGLNNFSFGLTKPIEF